MFITYILGGTAIVATLAMLKYRQQLRQSKTMNDFLSVESDEKTREIIFLQGAKNALTKENEDFRRLIKSGRDNLTTKQWISPDVNENGKGVISVIGQDALRSDLYFRIKDFHYNPEDIEDYDFAMREAEELIENLKA